MKVVKNFLIMTAGAVIGQMIVRAIEEQECPKVDPNELENRVYDVGYRDGYLAARNNLPYLGKDAKLRQQYSAEKMKNSRDAADTDGNTADTEVDGGEKSAHDNCPRTSSEAECGGGWLPDDTCGTE